MMKDVLVVGGMGGEAGGGLPGLGDGETDPDKRESILASEDRRQASGELFDGEKDNDGEAMVE